MKSAENKKYRFRRLWVVIPIIAVILLGICSLVTPSQAIVEARVNLVASYGNGFLAQVATTHAFCKDECLFFEVWSKCTLSLNQVIDIKVPVSGMIYGSQPTTFEAALYKPAGVGFVPWDGC